MGYKVVENLLLNKGFHILYDIIKYEYRNMYDSIIIYNRKYQYINYLNIWISIKLSATGS